MTLGRVMLPYFPKRCKIPSYQRPNQYIFEREFMKIEFFSLKLNNFTVLQQSNPMDHSPLREGTVDGQYDPFRHPPSLSSALRHYRSTLVGVNIISKNTHLCECCYQIVDKQRLDLRCSFVELGFLSVSLALYFRVIKLGIALLALFVLPFTTMCFLGEDSGQLTQCWKKKDLLGEGGAGSWVILWQTISSILGIYFIKNDCQRSVTLIEKASPLPQSYALKLSHLPACTEQDLKIWIYNKFQEYPHAIIFAYDTKQLNDAFKRREEVTIKLNQLMMASSFPNASASSLLEGDYDHLKKILREQIQEQDRILSKYSGCFRITPYSFVGVAFVIFNRKETCQRILREYESGLLRELCCRAGILPKIKYKESQISIGAASNPRDLIWGNLKPRPYKVLLTYSVLFVGVNWLLGPTFIKLILLTGSEWQGMLLWVCLFFYLLYHLLVHLFITFFLNKLECSTFTRRALISFYSYGIFNVLFPAILPYSLTLSEEETIGFVHALLAVDAITHSAIKSFNVANVYSRIFCQYINHLPPTSNPYTQSYFNRLMEGWEFKIGENYHYLFRGICLSAFFARPAPLATAFYLLSFTIEYWIQKYILLRKCKTPPKVSRALSQHFLLGLHFVPAIFLLGAYCFDNRFYPQHLTVSGWEVALGFIGCAFWVAVCVGAGLNEGKAGHHEGSYREMEKEFSEFYEAQNEINRFNGELKYRYRALVLRETAPQFTDMGLEDFFVEEQEIQSQKMLQREHHSLVNRLLSYSNEMHSFNSSNSMKFERE